MEMAHASQIGVFGLELEGGGKEMIDAPMLKQVRNYDGFMQLLNDATQLLLGRKYYTRG